MRYTGSDEVSEHPLNISIRQVKEHVSAEPEVSGWQRPLHNVNCTKRVTCVAIFFLQIIDKGDDNISEVQRADQFSSETVFTRQ